MSDRLPVERLRKGDVVQAVERGPRGTVIDADRAGWTLVRYLPRSRGSDGIISYKHGQDRLTLLQPAPPGPA
jgi:hypothetical protein